MSSSYSTQLTKARHHLCRKDSVLRRVVAAVGPCTLRTDRDRFSALVRSIIAQQISTRAAHAIRGRLVESLAPVGITPASILEAGTERLRSAGLSANKVLALQDLAERVHTGSLPLHALHRFGDEEVIDALLLVRGIGRWTAEMFLIFSLGRLDVLPVGDLGLRAGVQRHYGLGALPGKDELTALAEPWQPYRSVATWYFWRSAGFVPQSGIREAATPRRGEQEVAPRRAEKK